MGQDFLECFTSISSLNACAMRRCSSGQGMRNEVLSKRMSRRPQETSCGSQVNKVRPWQNAFEPLILAFSRFPRHFVLFEKLEFNVGLRQALRGLAAHAVSGDFPSFLSESWKKFVVKILLSATVHREKKRVCYYRGKIRMTEVHDREFEGS